MDIENEVQGKIGDFGYQEFDSSQFEDSKASSEEDQMDDELLVEPVESDADQQLETDEGAPNRDSVSAEDKEELQDGESIEAKSDDPPVYEPDFKYKVYDQEKDFPEEIKSLVKDKETENYVRDLLCKADGLEEMKPKHQSVVQERDTLRSQNAFQQETMNRVVSLKETNPILFQAELGIKDEWILKRANEIVDANETPQSKAMYEQSRQTMIDNHMQNLNFQQQQREFNQNYQQTHEQQLDAAFSAPEISSFEQQHDANRHPSEPAFRDLVKMHGRFHYEKTGQNLTPAQAVQSVYHYKKQMFAPVQQVQQAAPVVAPVVANAAPERKERPKTLPNTGRGRNVSPTGNKPKNLKEMRAKINAEMASMGE